MSCSSILNSTCMNPFIKDSNTVISIVEKILRLRERLTNVAQEQE